MVLLPENLGCYSALLFGNSCFMNGAPSSTSSTRLGRLLGTVAELKAAHDKKGLADIREDVEVASFDEDERLNDFFFPHLKWQMDIVARQKQHQLAEVHQLITRNRTELEVLLRGGTHVESILQGLESVLPARFDIDVLTELRRLKQQVLQGKLNNLTSSPMSSPGMSAVLTDQGYQNLTTSMQAAGGSMEIFHSESLGDGRWIVQVSNYLWQANLGQKRVHVPTPITGFDFFVPYQHTSAMSDNGFAPIRDRNSPELSLPIRDVITLFGKPGFYEKPQNPDNIVAHKPYASFFHNPGYLPNGTPSPFVDQREHSDGRLGDELGIAG